ncbi:MAG TPA: hypothetical protein VF304_07515 [Casimicrobiaceae bacterium]
MIFRDRLGAALRRSRGNGTNETGDAWRRPFRVRHTSATEWIEEAYFFFAALFFAVFRAPMRRGAAFFLAPRFLVARFFGAARFFVARFFVAFLAARFFGAARFFVAFLAARFFFGAALRVVLRAFFAAFFGAAALRLRAFFFGASAEAAGVIIDIMSAIIVASPV